MKYVKIREIRKVDSEPVYFINVDKNKNFIANDFCLHNCGYRGELKFKFWGDREKDIYKVGDRIGQLVIVPIPQIEWEEADTLSESDRGENGFGSTGK